jgi:hypothetical protein
VLGRPVNYIDEINGGRLVRYYHEIAIITETDGRIVTFMPRKNPKTGEEGWTAI